MRVASTEARVADNRSHARRPGRASPRLNNRPRGPAHLPRVLVARRQATLTLARQKCYARTPRQRAPRPWGSRARIAERRQLNLAGRIANSIRFPFNSFTYFLTLFSKSFHLSLTVLVHYRSRAGIYL